MMPMAATGNGPSADPERFILTAVMTITIVTRPADGMPAAPIAASVAVMTTTSNCPNSSSIPKSWNKKTTATASYNAVPSMLIVAPSGSTKFAARLEHSPSFSALSMVTGRVAELESVPTAVINARFILHKNLYGCALPPEQTQSTSGSTRNP